MRVFITGGTGLIGRHLVRRLGERGDQPVVLSRQADKVRREPAMRPVKVVQGDPTTPGPWEAELDGCDAVVNLAGHNLFARALEPRGQAEDPRQPGLWHRARRGRHRPGEEPAEGPGSGVGDRLLRPPR